MISLLRVLPLLLLTVACRPLWAAEIDLLARFAEPDGAWKAFSEDPDAALADVWKLTDGVLVCKGTPKGYIYTKRDFADFILRLEWRWPPGGKPGSGGVLLRTTGKHQIWPKCLEAQINAPDAGDFWGLAGFPLTGPAQRYKSLEHPQLGKLTNLKKIENAEKPPGQWNQYEITAEGHTVTLKINGRTVNRATGCQTTPGKILLTAEGDEIHFRNVKLVPLSSTAAVKEVPVKEIQLFNGKDLTGWSFRARDPKAKMENTFSVADGVLRCTGRPAGYLHTDKKYTNYIMRLEWRWPKDSRPGNNGVLLRIQPGEHFHGDVWPKSVEAQLANRRAGDIFTIGKFPLTGDPQRTKGRYTAMAEPSNEKPQGEWNQYEIVLKGTDLTLKVNGLVQNVASGVLEAPGTIGLQSEGAPIEYRNVRLVPLDE